MSALVVLAAPGVARGWLLLAAAVAGAGVPPVGSFTRARWSRLLGGDRPRLNTAFALESVLDQLVWVGGPAAASFLAAAVAQVWGLWATCAAGVTGTVLLAAKRSSDPRGGTPGAPRRRRWELPSVPVGTRALMVAGTAVGVTFGLADLSAVALAREAGAPELAGTVLGAGALGAVCGGLVVGARRPPEDPRRGLTAAAALFLLGYGPLALAPGLAWIIVISFVAGTTFAPLSVAANRLLEASSPAHRLTETLALFSATLVIGTALGSGLGGRLVDHGGARFSYLFTAPVAALPVIAVGLAVLARRSGRAVRTVG
ncbi:MFS transporter [Kineococcus sp. GCM10028916]|uniref:MFS transporter n=1 Tax=Kineococcus sp. GCM10028916 TaxID=3273394 RepID=UPI0036363826